MVRRAPSPRQWVLVGLLVVLTAGVDLAAAHGSGGSLLAPTAADPDTTAALAAFGVTPGAVAPWRPVDLQTGHDAVIFYECPDTAGSTTPDNYPRGQGDFTVPGCPLRIVDVPNPLGSPWIDVQPNDPHRLAFFSLHGDPLVGGPTERSRRSDTHTTFTTIMNGSAWTDQPIANEGPRPNPNRTAVSGEFATGAFDRAGNLYVGYLWNAIDRSLDAKATVLWLAKAVPMDEDESVLGRDRNVDEAYLYPIEHDVDGIARELHLVRVDPGPDTKVDDDEMVHQMLNNSRPRSPFRPEFAAPDIPSDERVVAVWGVRNATVTEGPSDYVDVAWSLAVHNDTWAHLVPEERIGPCIDTGRPAATRGKLYIPCVVGEGYTARDGARVGDIDVWSFDPWTGKTKHEGFTGLERGDPIIAANADGYMIAIASGFKDEPEVYYSFGWYGQVWTPAGANIGKFLHRAAGDGVARDARVTGAVLGTNEKTVLLVYHERQQIRQPEPERFDPTRPPRPREYTKTIFALNECDGVLAASQVPLGDGLMSFHWEAYQNAPGTFNDVQDGFAYYRDNVTGREYAYFALNDYGSIQYGRIPIDDASEMCIITPPPLFGIGTGFPQAMQLGSTAGTVAGASIGVLAAAMVAYLLTVKRRTATFTAAEDER